ncbi:MAG: hypothetical protein QOH88_2754 [Verrucomicrobiota bacterium]|jgi:hypothetical protein
MKIIRRVAIIVTALLAIVCVTPSFGASKKKTPPVVTQAPVIASVTATSITVTEAKSARTFAITSFTDINVNGQKATVADLKPGMTVNVSLGTDSSKASRIVATGK